MQTQPRPLPAITELQRARQAALTADDAFAGGDPLRLPTGRKPRTPWHVGPAHPWDLKVRRGSRREG